MLHTDVRRINFITPAKHPFRENKNNPIAIKILSKKKVIDSATSLISNKEKCII